MSESMIAGFVNDAIVRSLAGVPETARPIFLKMVYHGPRFTEELVSYDSKLVIGILGGGSGTTYDAFKLISEAQKYGARIALFGRKINNAENQLAFIEMLRRIVDGQITPEEAVRAYHGVLQGLGIPPYRSLEDDMQIVSSTSSYGSGGSQVKVPAQVRVPGSSDSPRPTTTPEVQPSAASRHQTVQLQASPSFGSMSPEERLSYHRSRIAGT